MGRKDAKEWATPVFEEMTAAHMNRPDVVRLLLERKADAARKTREVSSCGTVIERADRAALMYAAENAGPEVIKLLLDAGVMPGVRPEFGVAADPEGSILDDGKGNVPLLAAESEIEISAMPAFESLPHDSGESETRRSPSRISPGTAIFTGF